MNLFRFLWRQTKRERELRARLRATERNVQGLAVLMQDTRGAVVGLVQGANAQQDTINLILQGLNNEKQEEARETLKAAAPLSDLTAMAKRKVWIN